MQLLSRKTFSNLIPNAWYVQGCQNSCFTLKLGHGLKFKFNLLEIFGPKSLICVHYSKFQE